MLRQTLNVACLCMMLSGCSVIVASKLDNKGDAGSGSMDGGASDGGEIDAAAFDCRGLDNGTDCSPPGGSGYICRNGLCVTSVCGDGIVSESSGEECEDDNDVSGDGCEPVLCIYSCRNSGECDNSDVCDGTEVCTDAHFCEDGVNAPDETSCALSETEAGLCRGGVCALESCGNGVVDPGEDCDDPDDADGDGCDQDCQYSCHSDEDCGDGDLCNGAETCGSEHKCTLGAPVTCDDRQDCTVDQCKPTSGECDFVLRDEDHDNYPAIACETIPADCDDGNSAVYPGAPEGCDMLDNDCDPTTMGSATTPVLCYPDVDEDGFPSMAFEGVPMCECPAGSARARNDNLWDCFDSAFGGGNDVRPLQSMYYAMPYCVAPGSSGCRESSFDFNCNGSVEREPAPTGVTSCPSSLGCVSGWASTTLPECGAMAPWTKCTATTSASGAVTCSMGVMEPRIQRCR